MTTDRIIDAISRNPVIAAAYTKEDVAGAIESPCVVIFLLKPTIQNLNELVEMIHSANKWVFVHLDRLKGIALDQEGLAYLKNNIKPDGIISSRCCVLSKAKKAGLVSVQRIFVSDQESVEASLSETKDSVPDLIEVVPGSLIKVVERICGKVDIPVIASGIIEEEPEVEAVLKAGALSIATSTHKLWRI